MTATEPSLTREERAAIAGKIKSLVLTKHVNVANPSQDYGPWTREFDRRLDEVVAAPSRDAFENGVGSILLGLGQQSHRLLSQSRGPRSPAACDKCVASLDGDQRQPIWVFLNIIEDGPAHRAGIKDGDVLYSCDGKLAEPPNSPRFQLGGTHELQLGEIEGSQDSQRQSGSAESSREGPAANDRAEEHYVSCCRSRHRRDPGGKLSWCRGSRFRESARRSDRDLKAAELLAAGNRPAREHRWRTRVPTSNELLMPGRVTYRVQHEPNRNQARLEQGKTAEDRQHPFQQTGANRHGHKVQGPSSRPINGAPNRGSGSNRSTAAS